MVTFASGLEWTFLVIRNGAKKCKSFALGAFYMQADSSRTNITESRVGVSRQTNKPAYASPAFSLHPFLSYRLLLLRTIHTDDHPAKSNSYSSCAKPTNSTVFFPRGGVRVQTGFLWSAQHTRQRAVRPCAVVNQKVDGIVSLCQLVA